MNKIFAGKSFLNYLLKAKTAHDIHSPFVFDLWNNVFKDDTLYYGFELIESVRSSYLINKKRIIITDLGTGKNGRSESVSGIARQSLKPRKYAQMIFRLVNYLKLHNIIELGTSLGITTLYLALPDKRNHVVTIEGCNEIAALAQESFRKLKKNNIELITGSFDEHLPAALQKIKSPDMVFIDGNHLMNPTLKYFNECLPHASVTSVFIFDDIHRSDEMENAWTTIKNHPSVTLTIDLFQLGIVFFRPGIPKQHFMLKF